MTQMTVRIPDDLAEFIDAKVAAGEAPSRAAVLAQGLRELRHAEAVRRERETLARLTATGEPLYPDLQPLHDWLATAPRPELD